MSTERFSQDATGDSPDSISNDFEGVVMSGDLFIRELPESHTPTRRASEKDEEDEGDDKEPYTTLMLGEEGRGGDEKSDDENIVTTLALGEEGDRGGSMVE